MIVEDINEKRQYFRIQQDVIFNYRAVSNDEVVHNRPEQHFENSESLCLFSEFQQLDNSSNTLLKKIKQESPSTAEYLEIINKKLNLLCQQTFKKQSSIHDIESGKIDLSQGGFAFPCKEPMGIESWLSFKLIFLPLYTGVIGYAQVIRNSPQHDGSYKVGSRFHGLSEEQSKVIAKQILRTQVTLKNQNDRHLSH